MRPQLIKHLFITLVCSFSINLIASTETANSTSENQETAEAVDANSPTEAVQTNREEIKQVVQTEPIKPSIDLKKLENEFNTILETFRKKSSEDQKKFIALLEKFTSQKTTYTEFQQQWRALAYNALDFPDNFPVFKQLEDILKKVPDDNEEQETLAKNMRDQIFKATESKRIEVNQNFKKLNAIRSQILKAELQTNSINIFGQHTGAIEDIKLEWRLVSYQYQSLIQQKVSMLKNNIYGGFAGITKIVIEAFLILLVLCLPFIFYSFFVRFSNLLDTKQKEFFRKGYRNKNYRNMALWIQQINPFLTWVSIIILVNICEYILIRSTIYEFFILFSPFVIAYAYYRIFRIIIEMSLTRVLRSIGATNKTQLKERIVGTSKFIGIYFFVLYCFLYTVENAVSQGLIYIQVNSLAYWVSFFVLSYAFSKWSDEIASYIEHISAHKVFKKIADLCKGRFKILFCFPAVCLIVGHIVFNWLSNWLKRFEIIKKLSLKLLRVRLESSQKTTKAQQVVVPDEYKQTFESYFEFADERWIGADNNFFESIYKKISNWNEGIDDENTMALSGEHGVGKSYFLKHLEKSLKDKSIETTYISINEKLTSPKLIEKFFTTNLNVKKVKREDKIEGEDEDSTTNKKRVILVDNIQNLFLGKLGGFDGFNTFMQMINSNYKNVYWVCSLTEQSWVYLNCVTDSTHYFRSHYKMPRWSDKELQQLIMSAHNQTGYKHNYDKILFSATNQGHHNIGETFNIEERFFQLLWEQSEGNPQVAKNLWINSIIGVYGKHFKVGLPKDVHLQDSNQLTQNMLFIFAATFRHESLNIKEASEATNLPLGLVRQAYKRGLEEGMIVKNNNDGRYKISIKWMHAILKHLKRNNYLYGSS